MDGEGEGGSDRPPNAFPETRREGVKRTASDVTSFT